MTRYEVYRIVIRALNQKLQRTTRKATRDELNSVRDWLANDPAFLWEESCTLTPDGDRLKLRIKV